MILADLGCGYGTFSIPAARIESLAEANEVIVSSTVKDLVSGAGIKFEDLGMHSLKGIPEQLRLFKVNS
jgi:class 3 adenylate cyclase